MAGFGFQQSVGIGFETTFGTPAASPTLWVPGVCELKEREEPIVEDRPYEDVDLIYIGDGPIEVSGRIELSLYTGLLSTADLLLWFLNRTSGDLKSATVWKQLGQYTVRYDGVKVSSWELEFVAREAVTLSLDCRGRSGSKVTAVTTGFDNTIQKYTFANVAMTYKGASDNNFIRCRFSGENSIDDGGYRLSGSKLVERLEPGARDITVSFERDLYDSTVWDDFIAGANVAVLATATKGGKTLTVSCPAVRLIEADPAMSARTDKSRTEAEGRALATIDGGGTVTPAISISES